MNLILDKLKTIFHGKFDDILSNNNIKIFDFSKNTTNILEIKDGQKLDIDLGKANAEEKKLVKERIIDLMVQSENGAFLSADSFQKTKKIKSNLPTGEDEELLKFYKDKLKLEMYKALEASLVVRNAFKKGEEITDLKKDISKLYPTFGKNICNLVTREYFHTHFKDLYDSMIEDQDFDINLYQRKVEKIVQSLPYTVFVTRYRSYDDLSGEVRFKLEKLNKYGAGRLLLHGLGRENVSATLNLLEEYKDDKSITIQKELNPGGTIITATLIF
ncbi:MAG: hypothetical protein AABX64_02460 [Nanoarchaeota archaeon]